LQQDFLMTPRSARCFVYSPVLILCLAAGLIAVPARAQSKDSSSSSQGSPSAQIYAREKAPTLVDPAGPTVSLISAEPVFAMAAALNACGYDEGLENSSPLRKRVRDEMNEAFAKSEEARSSRDALCLFIAQHRMTGGLRDISQYISLSLYLTAPPDLEITTDLAEMPPDSTQVAEVVPLLKAFAAAADLHGIWLTTHRSYDEEIEKLHDPLSKMIVNANLYLKMPASTYDGRRFVVVIEPQLSPSMVNARIYGSDYVVVASPVDGAIRMNDVRHTYLHYIIDPLLYARSNALEREQPILKEVREAPMDFHFRSDTVALTLECMIKAIEARTMDTGIAAYRIPAGVDRSQMPRYENERQKVQQKIDAARWADVQHEMRQGFVLTQYFYEQMIAFEKDPAGLKDTIGEMVYSMDMEQQVHRARQILFDKQADDDVLQQRSKPHQLTGLDLAEARLATGDTAAAGSMAQKVISGQADTLASVADTARAYFILARVDLTTGHPEEAVADFQKTIASSKEQRLLAWSHIYLGRLRDLECKRDEAVSEYKLALEARDGQLDTRLAAERGVKAAYVQRGHEHECDDASDDEGGDEPDATTGQQPPSGGSAPAAKPSLQPQVQSGAKKPK
jgi:tetratricopeptide (TPR) repeat protein